MKKCHKCKETKPLTEFNKRTYTYDGYESKCKECINKSTNARKQKIKAEKDALKEYYFPF